MLYTKMSVDKANKLIDWAESSNIDWDIYDPYRLLAGEDDCELWLATWPTDSEMAEIL